MPDKNHIAGCASIAASIKSTLFSPFYEKLLSDENAWHSEIGTKPNMPNPSVKPIDTKCNFVNIFPVIEGMPLTWMRVERLDKYGVYYSAIALYGDRHWVTKDRAGALFLHVYDKPF